MSTPPLLSPQTLRFQEKREAILGAAAVLFNEHGIKGATLADIAGSVGLVTNSVTYYYRKKEDLATACFLRTTTVYSEIAAQAARQPTVEARVHEYFRLHVDVLARIERGEHPPLVQFNDVRALPEPHASQVFSAYTAMFKNVRTLLRGPGTEALSRLDLNARTFYLLSLSHWVRTWAVRYEPSEYSRVARRVSDIVLNGSAGTGAGWKAASQEELGSRLTDDSDATSDAFLRAASAVINEHGYHGASIDKISARLNVTKGSFYHHHDNKEELVFACFERSFAVIQRVLSLADERFATGWERVCAVGRVLGRFQLSEQGPLLRLMATLALSDPARREAVDQAIRRLTHRLASDIVDGMMDGSMRPLDPLVAAHIHIAGINSIAGLSRWAHEANADNVGELFVRPVFIGILCPPSGS
jgi:AcrR family transcriptional regulator